MWNLSLLNGNSTFEDAVLLKTEGHFPPKIIEKQITLVDRRLSSFAHVETFTFWRSCPILWRNNGPNIYTCIVKTLHSNEEL